MTYPSLTLRLGATLLGLGLVASPATGFQDEGSPPQISPAKASKLFKKMASKYAKKCKAELKAVTKDACQAIDDLRVSLGEGTLPEDIAEALLIEFDIFNQEALTEVATTQSQIIFVANNILVNVEGGGLPAGFITGDCATIDKLNADIAKELARATQKVLKKVKKLIKQAQKKQDTAITGGLAPPSPPPVVPADAPDPPPKKLARDSAAGANDTTNGTSGQLCLGGTYDPAEGDSVSITIKDLPGIGDLTRSAEVNNVTCRWRVCFGAGHFKDAPIPRGNYDIEIDQIAGIDVLTTSGGTAGVP